MTLREQNWTPGLPNHTCTDRHPLSSIVDCLELKGFPAPKHIRRFNAAQWAAPTQEKNLPPEENKP